MNLTRLRKFRPVDIVGDGLVSTTVCGEGRFMPVMILDTARRPDIDDLLRIHQHLPPGDVISQWATIPFSKGKLVLNLQFIKPKKCEFAIAFLQDRHASLIDAILHAQGLYFLAGLPGDKISNTLDKPKIMVEVPRTEFADTWEKRLPKILAKKIRENGLNREQAHIAAQEMIRSMRELWNIRRE